MDKMEEIPLSYKEYIINHVFLPLCLPQEDDETPDNNQALCNVMLQGIGAFADHVDCKDWTLIREMFSYLLGLYKQPEANLNSRIESMRDMLTAQVRRAEGVLIFPVREQNACVIVRTFGSETAFETFRIDPPNDVIMNTVGRVIRSFPDTSITVPTSALSEEFCYELSSFLAHMDRDTLEDAAAFTQKAGEHVLEVRDTASSHYITRLFMAILAGLDGSHPTSQVTPIVKHTRNDILWSNAYKPWRRSPLWLVMRVALQSTLHHLGHEPTLYKTFMVFFMTSILSSQTCHEISSDVLFCMQSKIANRMRKLPVWPESVTNFVKLVMKRNKEFLEERWKNIQSEDTKQRHPEHGKRSYHDLDVKSSTNLSLPNSRSYLLGRMDAADEPCPSTPFNPEATSRLFRSSRPLNEFEPATLELALQKDRSTALFDIEEFVLRTFLIPESFGWPFTPNALAECIQTYIKYASEEYCGNPETMSIMILTVFVLWVVLDQLVTTRIPLLLEYSPEIPQELLQPLMLTHSLHMDRYITIQNYLSQRYSRTHSGLPSIFNPHTSSDAFSNRYFRNSKELRDLKSKIEADAHQDKANKLEELFKEKARYQSLLSRAASMPHEYGRDGRHRRRQCSKCRRENEARDMGIHKFEWPLPDDCDKAERVVFEMDVPVDFKIWRTTTYNLLFVFCRPGLPLLPQTSSPARCKLDDYSGLTRYSPATSDVTIASSTKPFGNSHYRSISVAAASSNNVCVRNGLLFALYDRKHERWITPDDFKDCTFTNCCIWQIPIHGRYSHLSYAVQGVSHAPNHPISDQSVAPADLELNEHVSFGMLRSGGHIQWLNIAREIRTRVLSFSRQEVRSLVLTAALQVGPVSAAQLDWHTILAEADFTSSFLREIEQFLNSISGNWAHSITLETLIICIIRLLASTHPMDSRIASQAITTLRLARDIAFDWTRDIHTKLSQPSENRLKSDTDNTTDLKWRLCAAAALCRLTYNVKPCFLHLLVSDSSDIQALIECHIRLHDYTPSGTPPEGISPLLVRDRRFSLAIINHYSNLVMAHPKALDQAIKSIWDRYNPDNDGWSLLPAPNDFWAMSKTNPNPAGVSLKVHFNLLTGLLLIEGKSLASLPTAITCHPTYIRLLNHRVLDVIPSTDVGMDYTTRDAVCETGCILHFKLVDNNLIIKASLATSNESLELIPHTVFQTSSSGVQADFPNIFIENYCHWLKRNQDGTYIIEFREVSPHTQWKPSKKNWQLKLLPTSEGTLRGELQHGEEKKYLVDSHSEAFAAISNPLTPLESQLQHIYITHHSEPTMQITVELPRFQLSFIWDNNRLTSTNLRDMIVDEDQDAYTLYGLSHRLVLRSSDSRKLRSVLIPYGELSFKRDGDHVKVWVETQKMSTVRHFRYDINRHLQTVVGTTLLSELYRIYLHGLTSYPLPDPLLGHTGSEEALKSLCSATCKSFTCLSDEEQQILLAIAKLNPCYAWYPEHLQVMQTLTWAEINPLSQHWAYPVMVNSILEYNHQISIFTPTSSQDPPDLLSKQRGLALRALSHNYHLYSAEEYQLDFSHFNDSTYVPAEIDSPVYVHRSSRASCMSKVVQKWPTQMDSLPDIWSRLREAEQPISKALTGSIPSYSKNLLQLNISDIWLPFYIACTGPTSRNSLQSQLLFSLSSMAYQKDDIQLLSTLLAFATTPALRKISPPNWHLFNLSLGTAPSLEKLSKIINHYGVDLDAFPQADGLQSRGGESNDSFQTRRRNEHRRRREQESQSLAKDLISDWETCSDRSPPKLHRAGRRFGYINPNSQLEDEIQDIFLKWRRNMHFEEYINNVQCALVRRSNDITSGTSTMLPLLAITADFAMTVRMPPWPCLSSIVAQRAHIISNHAKRPVEPTVLESFSEGKVPAPCHPQFDGLLNHFEIHNDPLHQMYGQLLRQSQESMISNDSKQFRIVGSDAELNGHLSDYLRHCTEHHKSVLQHLCLALKPLTDSDAFQHLAFHWPQINTRAILKMLLQVEGEYRSGSRTSFLGWVATLRSFAASILMVQRAERLIILSNDNMDDLTRELSNVPSLNSQPADWMVIQIDGNFLARPTQIRVAQEMMEPPKGLSTVIQLNMGEGKSSVIVPLIACSLADGQRLARVIVLKPLAKSMFSLLVKRLSGLANRRVLYLPFSRDVRIDDNESVARLYNLYNTYLQEKGIIVAQPEHILSFRLMGIDLAGCTQINHTASHLLSTQRWLTTKCRDILDESDEILNVKYQLIYASGRQQPLENHPHRWRSIQEVLQNVKEYVIGLPPTDAIEVEHTRPCEFPIIRILHSSSGHTLTLDVAEGVIKSERFRLLSEDMQRRAIEYITQNPSHQTHTELSRALSSDLWHTLLLYRGLFACGILQFVFEEKRWRVNYGLDPRRTLLAVPYRAKDVPALRADFGHPDVALILTCLSYYYGGLTREQVNVCFQMLMKLDDPAQEYNQWTTNNHDLPNHLREYIGINLDDPDQQEQLWVYMKRNQALTDFYLSSVVFPREAKQFPKKLSTSAWDLAEKKAHPTTGFSGTNDNRHLLPVSISQKDSVEQLGTNARVIECLLHPDNDNYLVVQQSGAQILSSWDYLSSLMKQRPAIRVLLDVGAQMLDKRNEEVARMWLDNSTSQEKIEAIVFFNEEDQLCVMTRDYAIESFELSYYSQNLGLCAIYLDDAHTRGTDLKLPRSYRAAVTLGPKLIKDRLVQGCMRMRKLNLEQAPRQTVMFFAPPEVDSLIRKLANKGSSDQVHVIDVLRWVMNETCLSIRYNIPHWAQQGVDFQNRDKAWKNFLPKLGTTSETLASNESLTQLRNAWEIPNARTLEEMYGVQGNLRRPSHPAFSNHELQQHLKKLGFDTLNDVNAAEEQEREVSHEAEQEREVERPPPAKAAEHKLHPDVKSFVASGRMQSGSSAFVPLFGPLSHLDSSPSAPKLTWSRNLWSTKDFASTIVGSPPDASEFQRPVNWLLTTKLSTETVVALSPYEVNLLLPAIRASEVVHLHMYAPRVNPAMRSFEDLRSFAIPPLPSDWTPPRDMLEVNLWSGQLYFKDFAAYEGTRMVLGIVGGDPASDAVKSRCESDGFVLPRNRKGLMKETCCFDSSPLAFLKEVVALRQKGKTYQTTHIGKILDRRALREKDFN